MVKISIRNADYAGVLANELPSLGLKFNTNFCFSCISRILSNILKILFRATVLWEYIKLLITIYLMNFLLLSKEDVALINIFTSFKRNIKNSINICVMSFSYH